MSSKNSAVLEKPAQKSHALFETSWAEMSPQELADAGGEIALANLNRQIEKIARGEKVPQQ